MVKLNYLRAPRNLLPPAKPLEALLGRDVLAMLDRVEPRLISTPAVFPLKRAMRSMSTM